jgi:ParB family chromosome partitioning protein
MSGNGRANGVADAGEAPAKRRGRPPKAQAAQDTGDMVLLPISVIVPNPHQPRKLFDEEALDELAASIRQFGLLQPLVVRPQEGGYQIIAGERRWRAAQRAGLPTLPCRVLRNLDDEAAFILSVTENVARRDMTIIEEAQAYERIVALGRAVEEVAKLFGKSADLVRCRLDLLNLRDDLQHLVARGQLNKGLAWSLSRLSHNGQAEVMAKFTSGEFVNEEAACRYAAVVRMREEQPAMFGEEPVADELAEVLRQERRSGIQKAWAKLEALSAALAPFNELSPAVMADALGSDTSLYLERVRLLEKQVRTVAVTLCNAAAIQEARRAAA